MNEELRGKKADANLCKSAKMIQRWKQMAKTKAIALARYRKELGVVGCVRGSKAKFAAVKKIEEGKEKKGAEGLKKETEEEAGKSETSKRSPEEKKRQKR